MADVHIEGLNELVADLGDAPRKVKAGALGVITKGALNIKTQARQLAPGGPRTRAYPSSITFDVAVSLGGEIEAEIGPDKELPQGALGNLLEYGSARNAPYAHLGPAFDIEQAKTIKALEDLSDEVLW